MRNAGLEEAQLESRLLGETSIASDVQMTPPFIFWGSKSLQMVIAAMKLKDTYSLEGKL